MKKIILALSILTVVSCSKNQQLSVEDLIETKDVEQIRSRKDAIQNQIDSLSGLSHKLNTALEELDPDEAIDVKITAVQDTVFNHFVKLQANIETEKDVQVTPEFSGVMRLYIREGQYVSKGTLLAKIDDGGLADQLNQAKINVDQARAQLQQAEIQRDLAKTTFQKQTSLWNQKIGSEIQYLQAKTNYETSEKQVLSAKQQVAAAQKGVSATQQQLTKTNLYAPFSGVVEDIITQSGQVVGAGTPVIRLVNTSQVKAVANVPEVYLPKVKKGSTAEIYLPSLNRTIEGEVSLVSAAINSANRTFKVEVPVQNDDGFVKPNLNAEIRIVDYKNDSAIVVKENLVKQDKKGDYIFVVKNAKNMVAEKAYITTGKTGNGLVEIVSGIKSGDKIISDAPAKLQEGDKVEVAKK